jgi:hypothetical protein
MSELVTVRRCISVLALCCIVCVGLFSAFTVNAQNPTDQEAAPPDAGPTPVDDPVPTMLPHPESVRWWISGQANLISQWHPSFRSPYQA